MGHWLGVKVYTDASEAWGCSAFCELHWLQFEWPPRLSSLSIAVKQMLPDGPATACFGHQWSGKVLELVDNDAVIEVLKITYSKDLHLINLIRVLIFCM